MFQFLYDQFNSAMALNGGDTLELFFKLFMPNMNSGAGGTNPMTVFVAIGLMILYFIFLFQLFKNFFVPINGKAEHPIRLVARMLFFTILTVCSVTICKSIFIIATAPYNEIQQIDWGTTTNTDTFSKKLTSGFTYDLNKYGMGKLAADVMEGVVSTIILFSILINYFKLCVEIAERYVILGVLSIFSPLCIATGASETTSSIFKSWLGSMFSQCILMCMSTLFLGVFIVGVDNLTQLDAANGEKFIGLLLLLAWLRTGQRIDEHMSTLGLTALRSGGGLWADMFAGARLASGARNSAKSLASKGLAFGINSRLAGGGKAGRSAALMQQMSRSQSPFQRALASRMASNANAETRAAYGQLTARDMNGLGGQMFRNQAMGAAAMQQFGDSAKINMGGKEFTLNDLVEKGGMQMTGGKFDGKNAEIDFMDANGNRLRANVGMDDNGNIAFATAAGVGSSREEREAAEDAIVRALNGGEMKGANGAGEIQNATGSVDGDAAQPQTIATDADTGLRTDISDAVKDDGSLAVNSDGQLVNASAEDPNDPSALIRDENGNAIMASSVMDNMQMGITLPDGTFIPTDENGNAIKVGENGNVLDENGRDTGIKQSELNGNSVANYAQTTSFTSGQDSAFQQAMEQSGATGIDSEGFAVKGGTVDSNGFTQGGERVMGSDGNAMQVAAMGVDAQGYAVTGGKVDSNGITQGGTRVTDANGNEVKATPGGGGIALNTSGQAMTNSQTGQAVSAQGLGVGYIDSNNNAHSLSGAVGSGNMLTIKDTNGGLHNMTASQLASSTDASIKGGTVMNGSAMVQTASGQQMSLSQYAASGSAGSPANISGLSNQKQSINGGSLEFRGATGAVSASDVSMVGQTTSRQNVTGAAMSNVETGSRGQSYGVVARNAQGQAIDSGGNVVSTAAPPVAMSAANSTSNFVNSSGATESLPPNLISTGGGNYKADKEGYLLNTGNQRVTDSSGNFIHQSQVQSNAGVSGYAPAGAVTNGQGGWNVNSNNQYTDTGNNTIRQAPAVVGVVSAASGGVSTYNNSSYAGGGGAGINVRSVDGGAMTMTQRYTASDSNLGGYAAAVGKHGDEQYVAIGGSASDAKGNSYVGRDSAGVTHWYNQNADGTFTESSHGRWTAGDNGQMFEAKTNRTYDQVSMSSDGLTRLTTGSNGEVRMPISQNATITPMQGSMYGVYELNNPGGQSGYLSPTFFQKPEGATMRMTYNGQDCYFVPTSSYGSNLAARAERADAATNRSMAQQFVDTLPGAERERFRTTVYTGSDLSSFSYSGTSKSFSQLEREGIASFVQEPNGSYRLATATDTAPLYTAMARPKTKVNNAWQDIKGAEMVPVRANRGNTISDRTTRSNVHSIVDNGNGMVSILYGSPHNGDYKSVTYVSKAASVGVQNASREVGAYQAIDGKTNVGSIKNFSAYNKGNTNAVKLVQKLTFAQGFRRRFESAPVRTRIESSSRGGAVRKKGR